MAMLASVPFRVQRRRIHGLDIAVPPIGCASVRISNRGPAALKILTNQDEQTGEFFWIPCGFEQLITLSLAPIAQFSPGKVAFWLWAEGDAEVVLLWS